MQVAARLIEILRGAGVDYLFGNPGTTELPFLDALDGSGLTYVVALQEATAAAAADGYAQASGRLGVVNLHVAPGVANALSIVHNASRAKTPLLVTAGQQDSRLLLDAPILAGDMVKMTEGLTKWSYELRNAAEAPSALRRAIHLALAPPTGPVFLALPMDLMTEPCDDRGAARGPVALRPTAEPEAIARAGSLLARAKAPAIVAGDGVARAGAQAELVALAETLGAAVHGEPIHRRLSFPGARAPSACRSRRSTSWACWARCCRRTRSSSTSPRRRCLTCCGICRSARARTSSAARPARSAGPWAPRLAYSSRIHGAAWWPRSAMAR